MKKLICLILALALLLAAGCSSPAESGGTSSEGESESESSESSAESGDTNTGATEIIYSESFPAFGLASSCDVDFAKASLKAFFAPMVITLYESGQKITAENPITPELAYACFEVFLKENYWKIENYNELTEKTDDEYVQYYRSELVESFALAHFGLSETELRGLAAYDPALDRYEKLYYGGLVKGDLTVTSQSFSGSEYSCNFTFDNYLHGLEAISCSIKLEYSDGGFVLKEFSAHEK